MATDPLPEPTPVELPSPKPATSTAGTQTLADSTHGATATPAEKAAAAAAGASGFGMLASVLAMDGAAQSRSLPAGQGPAAGELHVATRMPPGSIEEDTHSVALSQSVGSTPTALSTASTLPPAPVQQGMAPQQQVQQGRGLGAQHAHEGPGGLPPRPPPAQVATPSQRYVNMLTNEMDQVQRGEDIPLVPVGPAFLMEACKDLSTCMPR